MKHLIALTTTQVRIVQLALAGYVTDGILTANENPEMKELFTKDQLEAEQILHNIVPLMLLDNNETDSELSSVIVDFSKVFESTHKLAEMLPTKSDSNDLEQSVILLTKAYHDLLQCYAFQQWYKEKEVKLDNGEEVLQGFLVDFITHYKDVILCEASMPKLYIPALLQVEIDNVGKVEVSA